MTSRERRSATSVIRRLFWPVYAPTALFEVGAGALVPVVLLAAIDVGFSPASAALVAAVPGVVGVVGPLPAGALIARRGERTGIVLGTALALLGVVLGVLALAGGGQVMIVAAVAALAAGEVCWSLARQAWVASRVAPSERGRAMSTYGGMQRLGRCAGPVLGAGFIAIGGLAAVFWLQAGTAVVAMIVALASAPRGNDRPVVPDAAPSGTVFGSNRALRRTFFLVGAGVIALNVARTGKDVLVPLVGHLNGLGAEQVSLLVGLGVAVELIGFVPAGVAMDSLGRRVVVATFSVLMTLGLGVLALGGRWEPALVVGVVVMGLGDGAGAGMVKTIGVDISPEIGRARFLGAFQGYHRLGVLLAPVLVAGLTAATSVGVAALAVAGVTAVGGAWLVRVLPGRDGAR